jgi:hypothetical protein
MLERDSSVGVLGFIEHRHHGEKGLRSFPRVADGWVIFADDTKKRGTR